MSALITSIQYCTVVVARALRRKKEVNGTQIGMKK